MGLESAGVLIVGAGAVGLSTAAALRTEGIPSVMLEQDDRNAGSWAARRVR